MYKRRLIEQRVLYAASKSKVVVLVGARQVGKSTLLKNLFPECPMITFNPLEDVHGARRDPGLFLSQFPAPLILDEIQFAPELLAYIKIKVDQSDAKGQYFLAGSQNLSVLRSVAESMAGRAVVIEMAPMTAYEVDRIQETSAGKDYWLSTYLKDPQAIFAQRAGVMSGRTLVERVWRGGYPGVVDEEEQWFYEYFFGYLKTYIDRDVRTAADIGQLVTFEHFIMLLAALTAKEINYSELGREIEVHGQTARRWLDIVRATYLWRDVAPFVGNTIKRVTQKTKGYFVDTGFACQLLRIGSPAQLLGHPMAGFLFETYVYNTIAVFLSTISFAVGVYHWRSGAGAEVDLVLEQGNALYPIEIKMKSALTKNDARGIKAFYETYRLGPQKIMTGIIVYAGAECYWVDHDVLAVPWNLLVKSA